MNASATADERSTIPRESEAASSAPAGQWALEAVYYALVLWIPIETVSTIKSGDGSPVAFSRILGLMLFGLALVNRRICFRRIPAVFWLIAWYLAVFSASQLWVPAGLDAAFRENQMTLIQMAVLFLISANLMSDEKFRGGLLRFYGWWIALVAVGMLLGAFGAPSSAMAGRGTILGQDPNVAAVYFALGGVCLAGDSRLLAARRFGARAVAALLAISVLIMAILQTGSRGGLLVFLAGFAGLAACGTRATRGMRVLIAGAVFAVLGVMVLWQFQQVTPTALRLNAAWTQGDTAGRTRIYAAAWSMFKEKPLLGYGGANNTFRLGADLAYASGRDYYRDTHNLLLAILTEVGLVGAVPFVAALVCALWIAGRHGRRTGDALPFALMCAQIAANTSLTGYHQKLFWIVLGAAAACGLEGDARARSAASESEAALI